MCLALVFQLAPAGRQQLRLVGACNQGALVEQGVGNLQQGCVAAVILYQVCCRHAIQIQLCQWGRLACGVRSTPVWAVI